MKKLLILGLLVVVPASLYGAGRSLDDLQRQRAGIAATIAKLERELQTARQHLKAVDAEIEDARVIQQVQELSLKESQRQSRGTPPVRAQPPVAAPAPAVVSAPVRAAPPATPAVAIPATAARAPEKVAAAAPISTPEMRKAALIAKIKRLVYTYTEVSGGSEEKSALFQSRPGAIHPKIDVEPTSVMPTFLRNVDRLYGADLTLEQFKKDIALELENANKKILEILNETNVSWALQERINAFRLVRKDLWDDFSKDLKALLENA